LEKGTHNQI